MKQTYKEQLADGRWLRKKNEILERDNYTCQRCGATSNLQVHHKEYLANKKAWEYSNEDLITLCVNCHENEHNIISSPKVGSFYTYEHSDYTDYLICYHIDYKKELVYLFGIDNGGGHGDGWILCLTFDEYYFKCRKWGFAKDYSEDNYMICSFLLAYEKQIKEKAKSIVCGCYPYTDEQVNKFASHKLKEIVEPILKQLK